MKHWNARELLDGCDAPDDITYIAESVLTHAAGFGPSGPPRLVHVAMHDCDDDCSVYEVLMELAPGVLLPTEYGLVETLHDELFADYEDDHVEGVIDWVAEGLDACMPQLERLADLLHVARLRARMILAQWQADGVPARLIDVRLAPYDHWRGAQDPAIQVLVEVLDDRLQPVVEEIGAETLDRLADEMLDRRDDVAARFARRGELMAKGASGTIDVLALNVIDHFGDRAGTLRRFASEWRLWLPDLTALIMMDGSVRAGSGTANPPVEWMSDRVTFHSLYVPAERLRAAVGRPMTELVQHEFLSDDMLVLEATCAVSDGLPSTSLKLDIPRRLFCSVTGRVWDDTSPEAAPQPTAMPPHTGTVVPFRSVGT